MSPPISLALYPSQFILPPLPSTLFVVHLHIKVITILLRHWDQDQISLRLHHPTLSGDPATYIIRSLGSTEPERTTMQTPSKWSSSTKKLGGWEVYVAQSVSVCVLIIPYPATHIYILYIYIFPFFCVWREIWDSFPGLTAGTIEKRKNIIGEIFHYHKKRADDGYGTNRFQSSYCTVQSRLHYNPPEIIQMVSITQFLNNYTDRRNKRKFSLNIRRFDQSCPFFGFKESIRQRDWFDIFHSWIFSEIGVDIEEDWHVDLIPHRRISECVY